MTKFNTEEEKIINHYLNYNFSHYYDFKINKKNFIYKIGMFFTILSTLFFSFIPVNEIFTYAFLGVFFLIFFTVPNFSFSHYFKNNILFIPFFLFSPLFFFNIDALFNSIINAFSLSFFIFFLSSFHMNLYIQKYIDKKIIERHKSLFNIYNKFFKNNYNSFYSFIKNFKNIDFSQLIQEKEKIVLPKKEINVISTPINKNFKQEDFLDELFDDLFDDLI